MMITYKTDEDFHWVQIYHFWKIDYFSVACVEFVHRSPLNATISPSPAAAAVHSKDKHIELDW